MPIYVGRRTTKKVGGAEIPQDILRLRRQAHDMFRRMGTPVVIKERYNDGDLRTGNAVRAIDYEQEHIELQNPVYEQTRNWDPLTHGTGFVGAKKGEVIFSDDEYFDPNWTGWTGNTPDENFIWRVGVDGAEDEVPEGYLPAPKYRGYGPGNLTYIIMPDRATDFYKASLGGPLLKVQEAFAIAPWWPEINDNDLVVSVEVGPSGNVSHLSSYGEIDVRHDRYEASKTTPISMRGLDRGGRKERGYSDTWGNRHIINQQFELVLIPHNDTAYHVEVDR
jgi:hypothetical protein